MRRTSQIGSELLRGLLVGLLAVGCACVTSAQDTTKTPANNAHSTAAPTSATTNGTGANAASDAATLTAEKAKAKGQRVPHDVDHTGSSAVRFKPMSVMP